MKNKITALFLGLAAFAVAVQAQTKPADDKQVKSPASSYSTLLAKLKGGDTNIDYRNLRMSYTETKDYSAYGLDAEERNKLLRTFNDKKYADALKMAEKILETNYVEMNSHFVAFAAYEKLGDAKKSAFHKTVFSGLMNSIVNGKDGKSSKTAYEIICVPEEYLVLNFLGYQRGTQSVVNEDGHQFDVLSVTKTDTKETTKLYFNIDVVWKGYEKMLGK